MASKTPIFEVIEQRLKEKAEDLKANNVKVEVRSPVEIREGFFKGGINFKTQKKIASFTLWEREITQVEVLELNIETGKSKIGYDGVVSDGEQALGIFDELCNSFL